MNKWTMAGPRVRYRIVPDDEVYDDSYLDTWGMSPEELKKERNELWTLIEREGVWGFQVEELKDVLCPHCKGVTHQEWQGTDSCWGIVGYDSCEDECKSNLRTLT